MASQVYEGTELCAYGCDMQAKFIYAKKPCCHSHASGCRVVRNHHEQTCLERYGVRFAMQNADLAQAQFQSSCQAREYLLADGRKVKLRGFERQAITHLVSCGIPVSELEFSLSNMPKSSFSYSEYGQARVYYPDFYNRALKTYVEVKSLHTLPRPSLQLKADAVLAAGYAFQLVIMNDSDCLFDQTYTTSFSLDEICETFKLTIEVDGGYFYDLTEVWERLTKAIERGALCSYDCGKPAIKISDLKRERLCCSKRSGLCPGLGKKRWASRKRTRESNESILVRFEKGCDCDFGCGNIAKHILTYSQGQISACCSVKSGKCPAVISRRWDCRR